MATQFIRGWHFNGDGVFKTIVTVGTLPNGKTVELGEERVRSSQEEFDAYLASEELPF